MDEKGAVEILRLAAVTLSLHGKARVAAPELAANFVLIAGFLETIVQCVLALDLYLTGSTASRNEALDGSAVHELCKGTCTEVNVQLSDGRSFLALRLPVYPDVSNAVQLVKQDRDERNLEVLTRWQTISK